MATIKKPPERGGGTVRLGNVAAAVAVAINYEAREIDANVNRSLLGTASGVFTGALGLPFNPASVTAGGGNECAGLDNGGVDTLRRSGEFFHQDRWEVRMAILQRYRGDGAPGTCQEYADRMATEARILDP